MSRVAVVGAGVTGLSCALALGERGVETVVLDRIPVCGGVAGWDDGDVRALERALRRGGTTRLALGVTALRWDGSSLLGMGQDGALRVTAAALVVAAGTRPLGRAELGLTGDRPAGVLPATVACHLSETGLLLGHRPLVYGGGDWARRTVEELLRAGSEHVTVLVPDGEAAVPGTARTELRRGRATGLVGAARIERVLLSDGGGIACDALVLAHGLAPLRNVDGAVRDGPRTIYAQPLEEVTTKAMAMQAGREAARAALALPGAGGP